LRSVQRIVVAFGSVGTLIPLLTELLEIAMDVLFELADGLGGECVRNSLALAGVLSTIARVEESTADRDEGIIVVTVRMLVLTSCSSYTKCCILPLQKPIPMRVDHRYSLSVCNGDMIWLQPDKCPILLMRIMHSEISRAFPRLQQQPKVGELCGEWTRDIAYLPVAYIW
jgi:hypothetical protein